MQKLQTATLVIAALLAPAIATAQAMGPDHPTHEFGVDLIAAYSKVGSGCTGSCGSFNIVTPVDVRIGLISAGMMQPELRLKLGFSSGGGTFIAFDPGVNLIFKMGSSTHMRGPYFTVGADANIISSKPTGGTGTSGVIVTINGGIGTRSMWGTTAAKRAELFVAYGLENTSLGSPSTLSIGARLGLSFFH